MSNRNNLTAYFTNQQYFDENEERLRTNLKENKEDCQKMELDHVFPDGALPLHYACLYNSTKFFMNPNISHTQINIPGGSFNSTPMMFTINKSNYKILLSFLLNDADIFQKNSKSLDVLDFCVLYDDVLGLILFLGFIEKPIMINKYLEKSQKENSKQIVEFLTTRKNEIEEKYVFEIDNRSIFYFSKAQIIFALICTVLCFFFKNYKWVIAAFYFFILCPYIIRSPFPFISNAAFSIYAYYDLYDDKPSKKYSHIYFFLFVIIHLISFLTIYFKDISLLKITKIRTAKSLITDLIFKDKYNTDNICLKCLNKELIGNQHCKKCKGCIHGQIFHDPIFDKCISSKKNGPIWELFNIFSLIFYFTVFLMNFKYNNQTLYVYIICFVSNAISLIMFMVANTKRKSRIQRFIEKK